MRRAFPFTSFVLSICSVACSADGSSRSNRTIGFWFEADAFLLPPGAATRLGAPISKFEGQSIERTARSEIERAFTDLRLTLTADDDAFWRVKVVKTLPVRMNQRPAAGESLLMGFLGGAGHVAFDFVAVSAIDYAPRDAARGSIVEAIGRGVGRVAVHEFTHQILGAAFADDYSDDNTYEYGRPDRPSQYYGGLHWSTAWPLLRDTVGTRTRSESWPP
jgi:hypothetical protein